MAGSTTDSPFESLLSMMRKQGSADNPASIEVGIMKDKRKVMLGDLLLEEEDLVYATLSLKEGDVVACVQIGDGMYALLAKLTDSEGNTPTEGIFE